MSSSIVIVFFNVNRSAAQASSVLETLASSCDVLCVQEPWHGRLKPIASTADVGPHECVRECYLYGTIVHSAWQLLTPSYDARVTCYVSRRLINAVSRYILNVSNDSQNSAVKYLHSVTQSLPVIDCIGGDFNTHAVSWDPDYLPEDSSDEL